MNAKMRIASPSAVWALAGAGLLLVVVVLLPPPPLPARPADWRTGLPARLLLHDELESRTDAILHTSRANQQVTFTSGVSGRGAWIDGGDQLLYPVRPSFDVRAPRRLPRENLALESGTVAFWHRPAYTPGNRNGKARRRVLFYFSGGESMDPGKIDRPNTILLEVTPRGRLALRLAGARATLRLVHSDASLQPGTWHHLALSWQQSTGRRTGQARLSFDGKTTERRGEFRFSEPGADFCLGSAYGRYVARGTYDRVQTWAGLPPDFGDLNAIRRAADDQDGRYAGRLVNDPLEDSSTSWLLAGGIIQGQRQVSALEKARLGDAKARALAASYERDGFVPGGHSGFGFACRGAVLPGQNLPPRLLYPTNIPGPALWERSSFWPARGSFEIFYKPDPQPAATRRTIFHLAEAPPPSAKKSALPQRLMTPPVMSWIIDPESRLVMSIHLDDGDVIRVRAVGVQPANLRPGRWVHLACAWDLNRRIFAQFVDGKEIESDVELPSPSRKLRIERPVARYFDVGHEKGGHVLGGVIDELQVHDQALSDFPAARGVIFAHRFDRSWTNVADYAEGDTSCFGLADPDVAGQHGQGVRVAGRAVLRFVPLFTRRQGQQALAANIDPRHGSAAFWVRPSAASFDGRQRMLLYIPGRQAPRRLADTISVFLKGQQLTLDVARVGRVVADVRHWTPDVWRHVAITWERRSGALRLYADGVARQSQGQPDQTASPSRPRYRIDAWWALGSGETPSQTAQAVFDDLIIYRRVLSPEAVKALAELRDAHSHAHAR